MNSSHKRQYKLIFNIIHYISYGTQVKCVLVPSSLDICILQCSMIVIYYLKQILLVVHFVL